MITSSRSVIRAVLQERCIEGVDPRSERLLVSALTRASDVTCQGLGVQTYLSSLDKFLWFWRLTDLSSYLIVKLHSATIMLVPEPFHGQSFISAPEQISSVLVKLLLLAD